MDERLLRNLSLLCAFIGLILLYSISENIISSPREILTISIDDVGSKILVCGNITQKTTTQTKHVFIKLNDNTGEIKVMVFNSTSLNIIGTEKDVFTLEKGNQICVEGTVDEYPKGSGELEIIYRGDYIRKV